MRAFVGVHLLGRARHSRRRWRRAGSISLDVSVSVSLEVARCVIGRGDERLSCATTALQRRVKQRRLGPWPLVGRIPSHALEPWVGTDGARTGSRGWRFSLGLSAQPCTRVAPEQALEEGEERLRVRDVAVKLQHVLDSATLGEGSAAMRHFVDYHTQRPPIDRWAVPLDHDDLWSEVLRCATKCVRRLGARFGEAEVDELEQARCVEHEIIGFEVTVHDALRVQIAQCRDDAKAEGARHVNRQCSTKASRGWHALAAGATTAAAALASLDPTGAAKQVA
eukprot:scaffold278817_cov27-Tisochrysis_lutea.AAC.2